MRLWHRRALVTLLVAGSVLGTGSAAAQAAPRPPDGTIIGRGDGPGVALLLGGKRVDFGDTTQMAAARCATPTSKVDQVSPAYVYDLVPAQNNLLYPAETRRVDVDRITPEPVRRKDCRPLYRADGRAPEVIFAQGFAPRETTGGQYDLKEYVLVNQPSPYVSTTYRDDLYKEWKPPWYYDIDAPFGIDVNATIGDHKYASQQEVAFPGGIDRRYVVRGCPVIRETLTLDTANCVANPDFRPWHD